MTERRGDRLRKIEVRESADMIEVSGDPNAGAGTPGAAGLLAVNPTSGLMYYNSNGEVDGWVEFARVVTNPGGAWNRSTDTSVDNAVMYNPVWESEIRDTDGMWSSGDTITIQTAGTYIIRFQVNWGSDAANILVMAFIEHEAAYIADARINSTSATTIFEVVAVIPCAVGDEIRGATRQYSGGAWDLVNAQISVDRIG